MLRRITLLMVVVSAWALMQAPIRAAGLSLETVSGKKHSAARFYLTGCTGTAYGKLMSRTLVYLPARLSSELSAI